MKKRNGFTIVELVIVIAVIAVLAAVLIPTFRGITDKAEESTALADSKVSYEEYLTKTLPENISKDLYVRVKNGYVHYIDGKAVKTNDSYVTTINEYVEWIDRNGDYRPPFYIEIDALARLFIDDYNEYNNESDITAINQYTNHNLYSSFWRKEDNDNAEYILNRWFWMFNFLKELCEKQKNSVLQPYIDNIIEQQAQNTGYNGYGYSFQNVALFFLKINGEKWNATYREESNNKTHLLSIYCCLDFTNITFGDYAPFIPYDQFTDNINYAKEIYLGNNNEHQ